MQEAFLTLGFAPQPTRRKKYSDEGRTWLIHFARTLVGPQRFISARFVLPPHSSAIVGFTTESPALRNELQTHKTFGVCRTQMPQCTCIDGPFRPPFAGARAKGKRSFRTDRQRPASFRTFGRSISDLQLSCRIIPTDLWLKTRTHPIHDVPGEKWKNGPWWIARFPRRARFNACNTKLAWRKKQVRRPFERAAADSQNFWRLKNENTSVDLLDTRQSMRSGFHLPPDKKNLSLPPPPPPPLFLSYPWLLVTTTASNSSPRETIWTLTLRYDPMPDKISVHLSKKECLNRFAEQTRKHLICRSTGMLMCNAEFCTISDLQTGIWSNF